MTDCDIRHRSHVDADIAKLDTRCRGDSRWTAIFAGALRVPIAGQQWRPSTVAARLSHAATVVIDGQWLNRWQSRMHPSCTSKHAPRNPPMAQRMDAYIIFDLENEESRSKSARNTIKEQSANVDISSWWDMHDIWLDIFPILHRRFIHDYIFFSRDSIITCTYFFFFFSGLFFFESNVAAKRKK